MCSLQEHIEREIRAREAERETVDSEKSTETTPGPTGSFLLPLDRRWRYQGTENHYGYTYHLWENAHTKRKFAWEVAAYRQALTKENANAS